MICLDVIATHKKIEREFIITTVVGFEVSICLGCCYTVIIKYYIVFTVVSVYNTYQMLHVRYIYLQQCVIFGVNVDTYSSTMEHMGIFL
jgi:hypothetical protein